MSTKILKELGDDIEMSKSDHFFDALIKNGYPQPRNFADFPVYDLKTLNDTVNETIFSYVDSRSQENLSKFLIIKFLQKLVDKNVVGRELWTLYKSFEEHRAHDIESLLLYKFLNRIYERNVIYFYVNVRKLIVQNSYGDLSMEFYVNLSNTVLSSDQIVQITVRAFEKILSDKGLAECVGNVVKNIDSLSVSLSERVPSLDFVNHCILEYKRLETKDEVAARRKEI